MVVGGVLDGVLVIKRAVEINQGVLEIKRVVEINQSMCLKSSKQC